MKRKTLTLPKKLDRMFGQVVIDLRGSRGEQKDRDQIRMYESTDENWSGQRQEEIYGEKPNGKDKACR